MVYYRDMFTLRTNNLFFPQGTNNKQNLEGTNSYGNS